MPIKKNIEKLLLLKDQYGPISLIAVLEKALKYKAYGASYIENILYQEMTPKNNHEPVRLKKDELNNIVLNEPSLAVYDSLIVKRGKAND